MDEGQMERMVDKLMGPIWSIAFVLCALFVVQTCDTVITAHTCGTDCAAVVAAPSTTRSTTIKARQHGDSCWCLDTKTGESKQLW
jgi:hypothetical protein